MTDHFDLIEQLQAAAEITGDELLQAAASALSSQSLSLSEARAENDRKDLEIERLKGLVAGIRECPQEPSGGEGLLSPDDIKLEVWPYGNSPGGQQCGTHPGVRVTHISSNTVATVECAGSQHRNKEIAREMILAAITHPRFRP